MNILSETLDTNVEDWLFYKLMSSVIVSKRTKGLALNAEGTVINKRTRYTDRVQL